MFVLFLKYVITVKSPFITLGSFIAIFFVSWCSFVHVSCFSQLNCTFYIYILDGSLLGYKAQYTITMEKNDKERYFLFELVKTQ